ncbi:MAG: SDR family oxidoreductase [Planctomycetes bacterium]|nr:SDR family oxidoreductase [Planctomycetota bacterium]
MTSDSRPDNAPTALVRIAPLLRGLLAQPTGNEDFPHAPVLLACRADPKATAAEADAVNLEALGPLDDDSFRDRLAAAVQKCAAGHHGKPCRFVLPKVGTLTVTSAADPEGHLPMRNRVALVTGSAGAIGYAVCRKLLESGCHLVVTDLPGERLDRLAGDLGSAAAGRVLKVPMDVTDRASIAAALATVAAAWGGIDIVVHNAGIAHVSTLAEMDLEVFRRLERVNVDGTLLVLAEAGDLLTRQATGGDIVIMSTKNVPSPSAGFGAYSATKAACHQLGRIASLELAPKGIRVNMVAPDAVFSEGEYRSGLWDEVGANRMKARGLDEEGLHEYYRSRNLLKARVTGRHVANAVYFFISRQTPTTGATIPVDGGLPDATPR